MEQKPYNGELRQLYNDIDKRLTVLENNHSLTWNTHDREAKEHRKYMHDRVHEIRNDVATVLMKLNQLPCESRIVATEHAEKALCDRLRNIDKNNCALWSVVGVIIFGWLATAWRVLFGK